MTNDVFELLIPALFSRAMLVLIIAGIAVLLVRELRHRLERGPVHAWHSRRSGRGRPAINSSAVKQLDHVPDCPMCDVPMVKRSIPSGPRAGDRFWACANFPMCRVMRPPWE
jgi:hypothetical protein